MDPSSLSAERDPPQAETVVVRALTISDVEGAAGVIRAAFAVQGRATTPPSSALRETAESVAAKIAAGGGFGAFGKAGLVAVALWQDVGEALLVARVCALPEARGRNLSRHLIAACEAEARSRGLSRVRLRVRLALPENEQLFARMGFQRLHVEAHAGFDAPTVEVLEKRLS
jgi:GNAT superfamily N-acetyltransferase